jgi:hypothetical protein
MVTKVNLILDDSEFSTLYRIARAELRNPADQAHYILRLELERRGLLPEATAVKGGSSEQ